MEEAKSAVNVSVLVCVRNSADYIRSCITSILNQNYVDFELVIIEESDSIDKTGEIIEGFKDKRIRYFKNSEKLGISKSRNLSVNKSKGEFIFFTDGDCIVPKNWIEEGLKFLKDKDCVGVEGKSYNVSEDYKPTFSDHTYDMGHGEFMTNNIAYRKSMVESVGGFDERYNFFEDRDLGLRILRVGKIKFNPNMKVFIQHQILTPNDLIRRTNALKNRVFLFKKFGQKNCVQCRIVEPWSLAKLIFPPLIFTSLLKYRFAAEEDFKLLPFVYVYLLFSRLKLWREGAKERVFLI